MSAAPIPIERDFAVEMRAVMDAATAQGPYSSRAVAKEIVRKLRVVDPELLWGWLDAQAEHFVWQAINDRDRSRRAQEKSKKVQEKRSTFAEHARRFVGGDREAMDGWLSVPFPVGDGMKKPLGMLMADDLEFVASDYDQRAASNAFEAAFFRALAAKVGDGTVADHFTDEQITAMRSSLV